MKHKSEYLSENTRALEKLEAIKTRLSLMWTQAPQARDAYGTYCNGWDVDARRWSLNGAINRECRDEFLMTTMVRAIIRDELRTRYPDYDSIAQWSIESAVKANTINLMSSTITRLKLRLAYEAICRARVLIVDGWTQLGYARNKCGQFCDIDDPEAARWSIVGAVEKVCKDSPATLTRIVVHELHEQLRGTMFGSLNRFNEHPNTTKDDVLKMIGSVTDRLKIRLWGRP